MRRDSWLPPVLVFAITLAAFVLASLRPPKFVDSFMTEDVTRLKQMVMTILQAREVYATEDGRIDVYRTLFREIELTDESARLLENGLVERGPTVAEIKAGDYTHFPWERAPAADVQRRKDRIPLLWYPAPYNGSRLVGFSNGAAKLLTEEEFRALK